METIVQDVRHGFRLLLKSPGFMVVAVITLALGIGANTAIFSVVNSVLLRPLPYEEPEQLVAIWGQLARYGIPRNGLSQPEYVDVLEQNEAFERIAVYRYGSFNVSGSGRPEWAAGSYVTSGLFDLLGTAAAMGRGFTPEEEKPGAPLVIILSDGFWRRHFGAAPDVIGRTLTVDGEPSTVIGVMPPGFAFPSTSTDLWAPLTIDLPHNDRGSHFLGCIARMKPGMGTDRASASLAAIARDLERRYPDNYKDAGWNLYLVPLHEQIVGGVRPALTMLLVAVGFVMLIACANVANLILARAATREREAAIRAALGAGRARLIRQFLTESVVLAVIGGGLGLLLAFWGIDALLALSPGDLPRIESVAVDGRVLAFSLAASVLAGALFGIVPALQISRPSLNETLKQGGGRSSWGLRGRRSRHLLVVAEVALSLVLLTGAGLMIRSFSRLLQVDPGFDPRNVLTARLYLTAGAYGEPRASAEFYRRLVERLGSLPGVESAAAISQIPMGGSYSSGTMTVKDLLGDKLKEDLEVDQRAVTHAYFRTMRLPLVAGRYFTEADGVEAPGVTIVDESFAKRCWPGKDPLGRQIKIGSADSNGPWLTIVGVVKHVKQFGLDVDGREQAYFPLPQAPLRQMVLVLRSQGDPDRLAGAVQGEVSALDKDLPIFNVRSMERIVADSVAQTRFSLFLLSAFAGVALALAAVGIYGVMAWSVSQRHHEIGIRMALGARHEDVLKMVLRGGLALTVSGLGIGLIAALALTRLMASLLFHVSAGDPATYAGVALLLASVAMAACYIPARRATRVDPMIALRYE